MSDDMRAAFEAWITQPPYELTLERLPDTSAWPGAYNDIGMQLAWEAWQQSAKRFETASGFSMQHGTCHLYGTACGLREYIIEQQKNPSSSLHVCWVDRVVLHE